MNVEWVGPAIADMAALDTSVARRIQAAVERLAATGAGDVKRLRGIDPPEYRLRVGQYRLRFQRKADAVFILRVRHRREVYR